MDGKLFFSLAGDLAERMRGVETRDRRRQMMLKKERKRVEGIEAAQEEDGGLDSRLAQRDPFFHTRNSQISGAFLDRDLSGGLEPEPIPVRLHYREHLDGSGKLGPEGSPIGLEGIHVNF